MYLKLKLPLLTSLKYYTKKGVSPSGVIEKIWSTNLSSFSVAGTGRMIVRVVVHVGGAQVEIQIRHSVVCSTVCFVWL